jgi:DNA modification methylase
VPVLTDETGMLIAGHGRLLAARQLGLVDVPVMVARGWSDARKRAYTILDNKLAQNAGWDEELLGLELADLQSLGFDLGLTGFDDEELKGLFARSAGGGQTDPDEVPDVPAVPVTAPGDVWLLGRHRLVCGDCTDAAVVALALAGSKPHLMTTDPPYGVEYDPAWRNEAGLSTTTRTGVVSNDDRADWRAAWALFPGDVAYVWHAGVYANTVADSLTACGFRIRSQIVWVKPRLVLSRGHYHWQHEPAWYAVRDGATGHWQGARDQTTVWPIGTSEGEADTATVHGTQKPVECMRRPIENNSKPGDAIYEPFNGSGTTVIAAEMSGRACHAIELDPAYVDVAILRWQAFTGGKATLLASGRPFDQIREAGREPGK